MLHLPHHACVCVCVYRIVTLDHAPDPATGTCMRTDLSITFDEGPGLFSRTKICTISPRYILVNESQVEIQLKQGRCKIREPPITRVPAASQAPWIWCDSESATSDAVLCFNSDSTLWL